MSKNKSFVFEIIGARPSQGKNEIPRWCDYVEMLCLVTRGGFISRGEIIDAAFKEGKEFAASQEEVLEDILEINDFDDNDDDEDIPDDLDSQRAAIGSQAGRISDNINRIVNDWIDHLQSRSMMFDVSYPFVVDAESGTIAIVERQSLTIYHKLYIYFLLAANLKIFPKDLATKVTSDFEFICFDAQKLMFPLSLNELASETHLFGKNPDNSGLFQGNLAAKYSQLAEMINALRVDVSSLRPIDSGDRGIDIVSFLGFKGDKAFGIPVVLSQCACSYSDWKKKQFDHDPKHYRQLLLFDVEYLRFMFIPFFYRATSGQWYDTTQVSTIVFDRLRLMKILFNQKKELFSRAIPWADLILLSDVEDRKLFASYILEDATH